MVREIKEETGLEVKVNKLIMKIAFNPFLFYFFLCDIAKGKISPHGKIKKVFWLTFEEILKSQKVHPLLYTLASLSNFRPKIYEGL